MIKTGEYIRTKSGYIGNVVNINEFRPPEAEICVNMNFSDYVFVGEEDIKTHSKNIIDLIEAGDIVRTDNKLYNIQNIEELKEIDNRRIEEILTHEIYEREAYKIE